MLITNDAIHVVKMLRRKRASRVEFNQAEIQSVSLFLFFRQQLPLVMYTLSPLWGPSANLETCYPLSFVIGSCFKCVYLPTHTQITFVTFFALPFVPVINNLPYRTYTQNSMWSTPVLGIPLWRPLFSLFYFVFGLHKVANIKTSARSSHYCSHSVDIYLFRTHIPSSTLLINHCVDVCKST